MGGAVKKVVRVAAAYYTGGASEIYFQGKDAKKAKNAADAEKAAMEAQAEKDRIASEEQAKVDAEKANQDLLDQKTQEAESTADARAKKQGLYGGGLADDKEGLLKKKKKLLGT